jgi:hypothetical protein
MKQNRGHNENSSGRISDHVANFNIEVSDSAVQVSKPDVSGHEVYVRPNRGDKRRQEVVR